jgi:hypothetical protein
MKKHFPVKLLLIMPYLCILFGVLGIQFIGELPSEWEARIFMLLCNGIGLIILANLIYPFVIANRGVSSTVLLFWNLILKLCYIPIHIMIILFGITSYEDPMGIYIVIFLVLIDYLLLLSTSMYGVSGLLQARREGNISTLIAAINIILHFFFCTEVISAVVMYMTVKGKD